MRFSIVADMFEYASCAVAVNVNSLKNCATHFAILVGNEEAIDAIISSDDPCQASDSKTKDQGKLGLT